MQETIQHQPQAHQKIEIDDIPFLESSATILSLGIALAALIRANTSRQIAIRAAEEELIKSIKNECEEKDEKIAELQRKIYRLENRLRQADIEISIPFRSEKDDK